MNSKQILTLNKRQSIVQRIDAMKSSFSANKLKDKLSRYHYFGYPSQILINKLISKIPSNTVGKNSIIAVVNDFGLEVISQLRALGYTNLILLCTESDDKLYNIIKYMVEKEFNFSKDKIVRLTPDMNDKFDLVIANPPYEIGNAVITETMRHCDEAVVLMPLKQYKKQDSRLWEKIQQLEVVNSSWFEDANMSDNLNIAYLSNFQNGPYKKYDDLTFLSLNDNYKLFYKYNLDNKDKYIKGYHKKYGIKVLKELGVEPNLWFAYTERTSQDGVHITSDCHDYRWNIEKNSYIPVSDAGQAFLLFAKFNSEIEHKNFCHWWYKSKDLAHKLIKGLNRASGTCEEVFPQIDWSRTNVEYTDEYVLSQMGLRWNENRDGVEKV